MDEKRYRNDAAPKDFLARIEGEEADRRLQTDLDRALTDKLMATTDQGGALARDLENAAGLALPTLDDIEMKLQNSAAAPTLSGDLFELDKLADLTVHGVHLNELLSRGNDSVEERKVLKNGLLFMRNKRYSEAAEWWSLNRSAGPSTSKHFNCLLTLLLALTYELAGNTERAQATKAQALQIWEAI